MKVGMIGLGRLGLPVAVAMARDHDVMGYDLDNSRMTHEPQQYRELGLFSDNLNTELMDSAIQFGTLAEVMDHADIVFVAVQTPHEPLYEGITKLPDTRADFDYSYLKKAIETIIAAAITPVVIVVISTVLPGTMREQIMPLLSSKTTLVYNPLFIAMGTVMRDFMRPEFILLGSNNKRALSLVQQFYKPFISAKICTMSVESAELTKVAYNTFISTKLAFVNTLLEVAHNSPGVNIDAVMGVLTQATKRLISPQYLTAGMGDGGGCHPRDNIAMSWLARKLNIGYDFFESIMLSREHQAKWLAGLMAGDLPKCILGYAFKAGTNIKTGSHALLVAEFLGDPLLIDPYMDDVLMPVTPHAFLIGINHPEFVGYEYPDGSVVIDPWRYIPDQPNCTVIRLGE